ncbi:alpha/beta hydrolase [Halieaceae bacterium IMCC14734]|uniref:Alpha/beta hydrolase n=1 Tax=Candidatus Litorirhabdus singularis TaxID=2518993 RepID=A0ABT3TH08_9GAMM|nr:YqiA/YcfP family alpha/beta fold hydrolase [Candidatus Litorirhabdus singularis]MCX2981561.1 alpha/beta hydrolase [Candidatus Litorirhabdus singularis]
MRIYFAHGKESGPWGSKIRALAELAESKGFEVDSVDYQNQDDPDARVVRLLNILIREQSDALLVGSSMGGYVSLVASRSFPVSGVFLMAPALYIPEYEQQSYCPGAAHVEIVHGTNDEVVPCANSERFSREHDSRLHLIEGDHRLNSSLDTVKNLFSDFLDLFEVEGSRNLH